ncbi:RagB/SusD family nutrient uptake outer membrane protein [Flavitalea flava]
MTYQSIRPYSFFIICAFILAIAGCKKEDEFLDAKPKDDLVIPSSLSDLQSLLQNESTFNTNSPAMGQVSSDEGYVQTKDLGDLAYFEINELTWAPFTYNPNGYDYDWVSGYATIYSANVILDVLPGIAYSTAEKASHDQIMGGALFFRANVLFNLLQIYSMPYDPVNSATDLGIPLRKHADINEKPVRATVEECYDQIIHDLETAETLLPAATPSKTVPSQLIARALLARIYLTRAEYPKAYIYADSCLRQFSVLTDYNSLQPDSRTLSDHFLEEDVFHTIMNGTYPISPNSIAVMDSTVYWSYDNNDLRKSYFALIRNGLPYYTGTYDYKGYNYSGISNDELYLIRAECNARAGNTDAAIGDVNTLLVKRWKTGTFVPYTASSAEAALDLILLERRKELLYRGTRWMDLRRLNKEPQRAITLTRILNGVTYTLPPNDLRYAFLLPDTEIRLGGVPQNPR